VIIKRDILYKSQETDTFEMRYFTCNSPIYRSARDRNWCTISTGLIIDVMQMYGKINLIAASPRRFHFNSKDVRSPACRRNYNSFNPWLASTFSAMQTQPESGKSDVTLRRVIGGVLHRFSFLISFVLTTSARDIAIARRNKHSRN